MSYRPAITTQFATYTPLRIPNRLLDLANSRIPAGNLAGWLSQTGRLRQLDELVPPTHCCHSLMTGLDKHRAWPKGAPVSPPVTHRKHHVALRYHVRPAYDGAVPRNNPDLRASARDSLGEASEQPFKRTTVVQIDTSDHPCGWRRRPADPDPQRTH
jgi:hypothetical protein